MKHIFQVLFSSALLLAITSCKKAENKDFFQGGTPPSLSSDRSGTIPLSFATQNDEAIKLTWTNPNYMFTTGISSHNVNYLLEIDTTGSNFTNPNRKSISLSGDLSLTISQSELNDYLLNQLTLTAGAPHNIEMRVTASIGNTVPIPSNVLKFAGVVPYVIPPKVAPPASGTLYFVGGDTFLGGWQNGGTYAHQNQEFTQVSPTLYEITLQLSGGDNTTGDDQYLFVPVWGDWSHKYACKKTADQPADGGDFGYDFSDNFPGPTAAGTYKITVDFQRGKYTVVKQ